MATESVVSGRQYGPALTKLANAMDIEPVGAGTQVSEKCTSPISSMEWTTNGKLPRLLSLTQSRKHLSNIRRGIMNSCVTVNNIHLKTGGNPYPPYADIGSSLPQFSLRILAHAQRGRKYSGPKPGRILTIATMPYLMYRFP